MRQGGIKMKLPKHDPDITFQIRLKSFKEGEIEIIETLISTLKITKFSNSLAPKDRKSFLLFQSYNNKLNLAK